MSFYIRPRTKLPCLPGRYRNVIFAGFLLLCRTILWTYPVLWTLIGILFVLPAIIVAVTYLSAVVTLGLRFIALGFAVGLGLIRDIAVAALFFIRVVLVLIVHEN